MKSKRIVTFIAVFLLFSSLSASTCVADVGDVWTLAGDFQNSSNPGPWVDPIPAGGGAGRWEYFGDSGIFSNDVISNPSTECNGELPTSGIGWTYTPGSHISLCKFASADGDNTNYQIDDVGGHSSFGVKWTTDHAGGFEIEIGGYHARIDQQGRVDTLSLKNVEGIILTSIQVDDNYSGNSNIRYADTQLVYLYANEFITVESSGSDWVGLTVQITEVEEITDEWPTWPVCGDANHPYPEGDINKDCKVDISDLSILAMNWIEDTNP